jgi:hypothetical protein
MAPEAIIMIHNPKYILLDLQVPLPTYPKLETH